MAFISKGFQKLQLAVDCLKKAHLWNEWLCVDSNVKLCSLTELVSFWSYRGRVSNLWCEIELPSLFLLFLQWKWMFCVVRLDVQLSSCTHQLLCFVASSHMVRVADALIYVDIGQLYNLCMDIPRICDVFFNCLWVLLFIESAWIRFIRHFELCICCDSVSCCGCWWPVVG